MIVLENYINSEWVKSSSTDTINVVNPANQDVLAKVPYGSSAAIDVNLACKSAMKAQKEWSKVPVMKRVQVLYKLKSL